MWGLVQRREGFFPDMLKLSPDIWKDGLRTAVAAGITLIVSRAFNLQHGYWAVITAVVIMQSSIGASLKGATSRLVGTLAGAAFCFAVAALSLCHGRGRGSRVDVGHRTAGFSGRLLAELHCRCLEDRWSPAGRCRPTVTLMMPLDGLRKRRLTPASRSQHPLMRLPPSRTSRLPWTKCGFRLRNSPTASEACPATR